MDFPESALTNVHRIDKVFFIQWSTYSLDDTSLSGRTRNLDYLEDTGFIPSDPDIAARDRYRLDAAQTAEYELRRNGHLVFHDWPQHLLWIFDLPGANVKQELKNDIKGEPGALLERYGYKRSCFGSLRASDLTVTSTDDAIDPSVLKGKHLFKASDVTNLQAFQANAFVDTSMETALDQTAQKDRTETSSPPQDFAGIYEKLISAITMLILSSLAGGHRYIPFSPTTYLGFFGLSSQSRTSQGTRNYTCLSESANSISLKVQWLSCGTVLIFSHPDFTTTWRSMKKTYVDDKMTSDIRGEKILKLAPIGLFAKYINKDVLPSNASETDGLHSNNESPENATNSDWKISISRMLQSYGIDLPVETRWIRARLYLSIEDAIQDSSDEDLHYEVLWPAHLSFYEVKAYSSAERDFSWAWDYDNHKSSDPLADAELWFLGKASREEALKAHHQRAELTAKSRVDGSSSDNDSISDIIMDTQRPIDQQALNGIYPTPPDGYRSQAVGTSQNAEHTEKKSMKMSVGSVREGSQPRLDDEQLSPTSPDADMGIGEYDRLDDEDLFGDMNTDMFTANGITEADFSFFDEPPNADDEPHFIEMSKTESRQQFSGDTVSPGSREVGLNAIENEEKHVKVSIPKAAHNATEGGLSRSDISTMSIVEPSNTSAVPSLLQSPGDSQTQKLYSDQRILTHHHQPLEDEAGFAEATVQAEREDTSSYRPILFKNPSAKIDSKYQDGPFASQIINRQNRIEPEGSLSTEVQLPRLNISGATEYEIDEDSDEINTASSPPDPTEGLFSTDDPPSNEFTKYDGSLKRKRSSVEDASISPGHQYPFVAHSPVFPLLSMSTLLSCLEDNLATLQNELTFQSSLHMPDLYSGSDESFIALAQEVAEHLILLSEASSNSSPLIDDGGVITSSHYSSYFEDPLRHILPSLFSHCEPCTFKEYIATGKCSAGLHSSSKVAVKTPQRKCDTVKGTQDDNCSGSIFSIPPPNMLVQRGENLMEISAAALPFWQELGLGPCAGSKDIRAICCFPNSQQMRRGGISFLEAMRSTYQSLRLGFIETYDSAYGPVRCGQYPFNLKGSSIDENLQCLDKMCDEVGDILSNETNSPKPTVIYMVNPFAEPQALPRLVSSFAKILAHYTLETKDDDERCDMELVLKIIPIAMIASSTTISLPSPEIYMNIARETYELFQAQNSSEEASSFASASLFQLAEGIPKTINLRLATEPSPALYGDNASYHLAYSWDSEGQWLSVSVTDTYGSRHWNASYCLGTRFQPWPIFRDAAEEIWEAALDVIDVKWTSCQVIVVKDEIMLQEEIDIWVSLAARSDTIRIDLVLVTVDSSTPLHFTGDLQLPTSLLQNEQAMYNTPVTTPLAASHNLEAISPGVSGWPSTPRSVEAFDADPNARLIDKADETWGVVASCTLDDDFHNSALASGYLLKRAGASDHDGLVIMGVRVIFAEKSSESLLREILTMYRALGTLARARGVTHSSLSVLPWHVAVARKAREGLNQTMRWEEPMVQ